jgi:hypothetical protein
MGITYPRTRWISSNTYPPPKSMLKNHPPKMLKTNKPINN